MIEYKEEYTDEPNFSLGRRGKSEREIWEELPVKYELPVQTEIPSVISVPRAEMCSNALLFYDAFRGLCRLRIDYAENKANKMLISAQLSDPDEAERLFQKEKFWLNVKDYWKAKLELSYKWEKDYFGRK